MTDTTQLRLWFTAMARAAEDESGALDELVSLMKAAEAAEINSSGGMVQLAFLQASGTSVEDVLKQLDVPSAMEFGETAPVLTGEVDPQETTEDDAISCLRQVLDRYGMEMPFPLELPSETLERGGHVSPYLLFTVFYETRGIKAFFEPSAVRDADDLDKLNAMRDALSQLGLYSNGQQSYAQIYRRA